jgi:membrane-bound inhibitor of C-type lysozyme
MTRARASIVPAFASAAMFVAGCAAPGLPTAVIPLDNIYNCQDAKPLRVSLSPDWRSAEIGFERSRLVLPRVDSAAQAKFSNGASTLYLDGQQALFTSDSFVVAGPCVSAVPLPVVPQVRY